MALTQYGPVTLLWGVPAERGHSPGSVVGLMPGLLKGYRDRSAPDDNAHNSSFDGSLQLCTNACVLHHLQTCSAQAADRTSSAAEAP